MSERKVTQKNEAGVRRNCWLRTSSDFCDTQTRAATVGTSEGPPLKAVICAVVIARQQGPPSDQQWLGCRGLRKGGGLWSTTRRNKHISAQITTPTWTVSSSVPEWNKLSITNDSSEGVKVIAGDYPRFIWNDTALKTDSLQMTCGYSIHHLYLIFGRSVKMSCINKKRWKYIGAFGNSVLWGWIEMPRSSASQSQKGRN